MTHYFFKGKNSLCDVIIVGELMNCNINDETRMR